MIQSQFLKQIDHLASLEKVIGSYAKHLAVHGEELDGIAANRYEKLIAEAGDAGNLEVLIVSYSSRLPAHEAQVGESAQSA